MNKKIIKSEFKVGNNNKYKIKAIQDSIIYIKELESGQLPGFYYVVAWKVHSEEKNT